MHIVAGFGEHAGPSVHLSGRDDKHDVTEHNSDEAMMTLMADSNAMLRLFDTGALQEDAAGRIQSTAEAVEEQAVAHILGVQDASVLEANVMGGMISATGAEGSARQLMQFITPAGFNRTHYLVGHASY